MATLTVTGHVDDQHRLTANVPETIPPGPVTITVSPVASEDDAGQAWMAGIAREWGDELGDPREDIYSMTDGGPVSAT